MPERMTGWHWWQLVGTCCDFEPFSRDELRKSAYVSRGWNDLKQRLGTCVLLTFLICLCFDSIRLDWAVFRLSLVWAIWLQMRHY